MDLRVLGPVEAHRPGGPVPLGRRRERLLLGLLLLEPGHAIGVPRLIALLWPHDPPAEPVASLKVHASRLRAVLRPEADIVGGDGRYRLDPRDATVDVVRFIELAARARRTADPSTRLRLLDDAIALWRGEPLADVLPAEHREPLAKSLVDARTAAVERRARTHGELGNHDAALADIAPLTAAQPLREDLVAVHMTALAAAGRQAEAFALYQSTAELLAAELGVDPGARLRAAHLAILRGEAGAPVQGASVPAELPADLASFGGRDDEVARLLDEADEAATLVVDAIDGMGGVGKTVLAVHLAHRLSGRFPDGQLFCDLRGHSEGLAPADPGEALGRMLRALGLPGERVPSDVDEREAAYRSLLAGRRVLVVLDNAASEEQVARLLPGAPGCRVLVTSRRRLSGLDDARRLTIGPLPDDEAAALFARIVGAERAASTVDLAVVVRLCGGLPLAIRLAAARMRARPSWTLADLIERLRDRDRLAELSVGARGVAAALELSYRDLDPLRRKAFRCLGGMPGVDVDRYGAAALVGAGLKETERRLESLVDENLLDDVGGGRYRMHDLVREFAASVMGRDGSDARERALGFYIYTAAQATKRLKAGRGSPVADPPAPTTPVPAFGDRDAALAWYDAEWPTLGAVVEATGSWGLQYDSWEYANRRSMGGDWLARLPRAMAAARAEGAEHAHAKLLSCEGSARLQAGGGTEARGCYAAAREIHRALGDRYGEAIATANLGASAHHLGDFREALAHFEAAREVIGERDPAMYAIMLDNLGAVHMRLGAFEAAHDYASRAIARAREHGQDTALGFGLLHLGEVCLHLGRPGEAVKALREALDAHRAVGRRRGESSALGLLGRARLAQARLGEAGELLGRALDVAKGIGDLDLECTIRLDMAALRLAEGDTAAAREAYAHAHAIAAGTGIRYERALALSGLAATEPSPRAALARLAEAHALFAETGAFEAAATAKRLSAATQGVRSGSADP